MSESEYLPGDTSKDIHSPGNIMHLDFDSRNLGYWLYSDSFPSKLKTEKFVSGFSPNEFA